MYLYLRISQRLWACQGDLLQEEGNDKFMFEGAVNRGFIIIIIIIIIFVLHRKLNSAPAQI